MTIYSLDVLLSQFGTSPLFHVQFSLLFLDLQESWAPKNWFFWTVVLEETGESLGLQGDQTSQSLRKSNLNIHWKEWCWSWSSNTLATWCKEPTHWKRPWYWERLKTEGANRWWDDWIALPTQWAWVWANSGRYGSLVCSSPWGRRVRHNLVTKQQLPRWYWYYQKLRSTPNC